MREPKCRAWHKQQKKMYRLKSLIWFDEKIDPDMLQFVYLNEQIDEHITRLHILSPDDVELMQFTGLKDCVGQDICEDDIVLVNGGESGLKFVSRVVFAQAAFRIADAYDQGFPHTQDIEVIGNIYENEGLLKS